MSHKRTIAAYHKTTLAELRRFLERHDLSYTLKVSIFFP